MTVLGCLGGASHERVLDKRLLSTLPTCPPGDIPASAGAGPSCQLLGRTRGRPGLSDAVLVAPPSQHTEALTHLADGSSAPARRSRPRCGPSSSPARPSGLVTLTKPREAGVGTRTCGSFTVLRKPFSYSMCWCLLLCGPICHHSCASSTLQSFRGLWTPARRGHREASGSPGRSAEGGQRCFPPGSLSDGPWSGLAMFLHWLSLCLPA